MSDKASSNVGSTFKVREKRNYYITSWSYFFNVTLMRYQIQTE